MRWIPIVHHDTHTVGVARFDGDALLDVHWVGVAPHSVSPEQWQSLLALVAPEHRGTGEGWMVRASQEALRGLAGRAFEPVRVEGPAPDPSSGDPREAQLQQLRQTDPEGAKLVERTIQVERDLLERLLEVRVVYVSEVALAAAAERTLSEYDRAVLATAIDTPDLAEWCAAIARRWWATEPRLRGD
ncbi:MAG: hypothetical protein R3F61_15405 [Myxococcota bacterium]